MVQLPPVREVDTRVELPVAHVGAEAELMAPPHHGHVVGEPVELVRRPPLRRSLPANRC